MRGVAGAVRHIAVALLLAVTSPSVSAADEPPAATRAAARALGEEGLDRYDAGDFAAALDRFERAHALVHLPTTALWAARCLVHLGRLVEADDRFIEATRVVLPPSAAPVLVRAKEEAERERSALTTRLPRIAITVVGARGDAVVEVDGRPMPRALEGVLQPLDPGPHEVAIVGRAGRVTRHVTLAEGAHEALTLRADAAVDSAVARGPAPSAAPPREGAGAPAPWTRTAAFVALSAGGALVTVGAVAGGVAASKHQSLAPACPGDVCPPSRSSDVDDLDRFRVGASVGLIAGGALVTTGIVLLLLSPSTAPPTASRRQAWPPALTF